MQVEVLKLAMLTERDKLKAERENSQVIEQLAARMKEVEQLTERLQSCDREWQTRLTAETNKWQARLAEHQQDVETERDKMAEAIAGMVPFPFRKKSDKFSLWADLLIYHYKNFH
jgi:predicted transcriptional regulator